MSSYIETVIIGAGQAGLAVSYYLSRLDRPHVVLEQAAQAGNAWPPLDSFTLTDHLKEERYEYRGEDSLDHRRQPRHR